MLLMNLAWLVWEINLGQTQSKVMKLYKTKIRLFLVVLTQTILSFQFSIKIGFQHLRVYTNGISLPLVWAKVILGTKIIIITTQTLIFRWILMKSKILTIIWVNQVRILEAHPHLEQLFNINI